MRRLERRFARLEQQLGQMAHALTHHPQERAQPLGELVAQLTESQAQQLSSSTQFIRAIHEIAIERAGAALGRKGGARRAATAKRDSRGRMLPNRAASDCPLCADPLTASFSVDQWSEHQKHKGGGAGYSPKPAREEVVETQATPVAEHSHDHIVQYPLPTVSREYSDSGASGNPTESATEYSESNGTTEPEVDISRPNGISNGSTH